MDTRKLHTLAVFLPLLSFSFATTPVIAEDAEQLLTLTDAQMDRVTAARGIFSQNEATAFVDGNFGFTDTTTFANARARFGSGLARAVAAGELNADGTASTTLAIDDDPNDLVVEGFAASNAGDNGVIVARTSGMVFDGRRVNVGVVRATTISSGDAYQDGVATTSGAANGDIVAVGTNDTTREGSNFWITHSRTIVVSVDLPGFVTP